METFITDHSDSAKKKIGTKCYYCTFTGFMFDEEELKTCFSGDKHRQSYGCCCSCDRSDYAHHKKWGTRGEHMIPLGKDPIVEVQFNDIPKELKIKRTIIDYKD